MSVATAVTALETRRDAVITELAALGVMGPNFGLDGVSIDWLQYAKDLRNEVLELTKAIEDLSGPCIVYTQGR